MTNATPARRDAFLAALENRRLVMGIVNATPDSFSDGGLYAHGDAALAQALRLEAEGADVIDLGAESTRPGALALSEAQEHARLDAVLDRLAGALSVPLSIDTYKAGVARRACAAGASIVNDVWGLQKDPAMAGVVADAGAVLIVMHNRATVEPALDIFDDMRRFFDHSLELAAQAGVPPRHVLLDPGIGFGKTLAQNLAVLHGLARLRDYGLPLVVGLSRKRFIGAITGAEVGERLPGGLAAHVMAALAGARVVRVHDVAPHVAALKMVAAIEGGA